MNHTFIAGHLGSDPQVRYTASGTKVTSFRLAARARRGGKDETIWWKVTVWGDQFEKMMSYLKKGSSVIVMGEMSKPEIFNDREGRPQISLNVNASNISFSPFGRSDKGEQGQSRPQQNAGNEEAKDPFAGSGQGFHHGDSQQQEYAESGSEKEEMAFMDDEIPF